MSSLALQPAAFAHSPQQHMPVPHKSLTMNQLETTCQHIYRLENIRAPN